MSHLSCVSTKISEFWTFALDAQMLGDCLSCLFHKFGEDIAERVAKSSTWFEGK